MLTIKPVLPQLDFISHVFLKTLKQQPDFNSLTTGVRMHLKFVVVIC